MGYGRRAALGTEAERTALRFLVSRGLQPITRNFRNRGGEIDLIMLDGSCLAFIEVRCRSSTLFSRPELTVDLRKQRKIIRTAAMFIAGRQAYARHCVRFDVVAVTAGGTDDIRWIRDAFRPQDSML